MTLLFRHDFATMSPWTDRPDPFGGQDLPIGADCSNIFGGKGVLRLRDDPLRCGMIWVPPDVFTVTFGIVRARMRFPAPLGAHSCLWLQSVTPYATKDDHEVDVNEHFGRANIFHGIHWRDAGQPLREQAGVRMPGVSTWHEYEVECRSEGYIFRIDGRETYRTKLRGTDRPKTLILSILSDDWERDDLQADNLNAYKVFCDWVEVHS